MFIIIDSNCSFSLKEQHVCQKGLVLWRVSFACVVIIGIPEFG